MEHRTVPYGERERESGGGRDGGKGREGMNTSVNKGYFTNGMGGLQEISIVKNFGHVQSKIKKGILALYA